MGDIFVLALVSAANPTLLAAVTLMLFLPSPKRLLLGYLAGALLVSLSIGFVIVFAVHDSSATSTSRSTISPSLDIVFGLILLLVAYVLNAGHDQRLKERRSQRKLAKSGGEEPEEKGPSKVEQLLTAPARYGALSSSTSTRMPSKSITTSPSRSVSSSRCPGSPILRRSTICRPSATGPSPRSS